MRPSKQSIMSTLRLPILDFEPFSIQLFLSTFSTALCCFIMTFGIKCEPFSVLGSPFNHCLEQKLEGKLFNHLMIGIRLIYQHWLGKQRPKWPQSSVRHDLLRSKSLALTLLFHVHSANTVQMQKASQSILKIRMVLLDRLFL